MIARSPFLIGVLLLLGGFAGCVDSGSFYISQAAKPGAKCEAETGSTGFMPTGTLDVSLKLGYLLFPVVVNSLEESSMKDEQPERNILFMKEFKTTIDLQGLPGQFPTELLEFSAYTSGTVAPGEEKAFKAEVVQDALAALFAAVVPIGNKPVILVKLRAVAERGGTAMDSASFSYPITLCNGCLVDFRDPCPDPKDTTAVVPVLTNTCGRPQDEPVTCCTITSSPIPRCLGEGDQ